MAPREIPKQEISRQGGKDLQNSSFAVQGCAAGAATATSPPKGCPYSDRAKQELKGTRDHPVHSQAPPGPHFSRISL